MRVAFFGTPQFALPALQRIHREHQVVLVVAQPDRPAGRGMRLQPPPVAAAARELGLPLEQPGKLRGNSAFREALAQSGAEVAVTAAYGNILPQALLDVPEHGFLNVHGSLLPHYRGAAPIQWALIDGREETGVSIMRTEAGLDTGPVCHVLRTPIGPDERSSDLFARLAVLGAQAISEALGLLERGELECRAQDDSQATLAPLLRKEDGDVDWTGGARAIYDRFRGVAAWPGTRLRHAGKEVRVLDMRPAPQGTGEAGTVLAVGPAGVTVAAGEGAVLLERVQPPGKRPMNAFDWANGYGIRKGDRLA